MDIKKTHELLVNKNISCRELIAGYFEKIKKKERDLHAFLDVYEDEAFCEAQAVDEKIERGESIGMLEGIPIAIKDNILMKGKRATAGSRVLGSYVAPYDATAVKKLKDTGAIFIGKTNLDEFAMGSSTEHSAFGPTKNPRDEERVPGGSSGGSAAAVAAEECVAALGSDTGGSIRQPAAFCGIVGLKPTYGAVSRYGLIAMASSLDQIGPLARSVHDAKILFEIIRGNDWQDATTVARNFQFPISHSQMKEIKIGIPKEYLGEGLEEETRKAFGEARTFFEKEGFAARDISLPHTSYALATYYLIMSAEASANLARYDGVRYGGARELFGEEVKRRIMLGAFVLSHGYYDAYYVKAQKARALITKDFSRAFEEVDVILAPATPTPAFRLGEKMDDPLTMYLSDIYTVTANLAGLPAMSLPLTHAAHDHLPRGLQMIAPPFREDYLFTLGSAYEHR